MNHESRAPRSPLHVRAHWEGRDLRVLELTAQPNRRLYCDRVEVVASHARARELIEFGASQRITPRLMHREAGSDALLSPETWLRHAQRAGVYESEDA